MLRAMFSGRMEVLKDDDGKWLTVLSRLIYRVINFRLGFD